MQAIILAAGLGTRLNREQGKRPKCLAPVGGRTLLDHQVSALKSAGAKEICVVLGYRASCIRQLISEPCDFIYNHRYRSTNSLYSLWLARQWVRGQFVLCNSDVLADDEIYTRTMQHPGCALAYDSGSGDDEEHMKVSFRRDGSLGAISKQMKHNFVDGENVGIVKFDSSSAEKLFVEASRALSDQGRNQWAPAALDRVAQSHTIRGVDISGLPWIEVDYPEDLRRAQTEVWLRMVVRRCDSQHSTRRPEAERGGGKRAA